jgi:hypothetical protein
MLVALASVVVDHIQQHLQTGRVQARTVTWNSATSPPGRPGPRRGRLATAGGPLPRIRPLRPPSTLTPLGKYPPARPRRRDVATPEGQAGGRCLNLLAALRLRACCVAGWVLEVVWVSCGVAAGDMDHPRQDRVV